MGDTQVGTKDFRSFGPVGGRLSPGPWPGNQSFSPLQPEPSTGLVTAAAPCQRVPSWNGCRAHQA